MQVQLQHLWVILNILDDGSEQLCRCVPREASETRFYPKTRWFSTNQATKLSRISQMVGRLCKTFSRYPGPVFTEFQYSATYGKMFFQQDITDPKSVFRMRTVNPRHCYQIACSAHPTSTSVTGQCNFFSGKVQRTHAWYLHRKKEGNIS